MSLEMMRAILSQEMQDPNYYPLSNDTRTGEPIDRSFRFPTPS